MVPPVSSRTDISGRKRPALFRLSYDGVAPRERFERSISWFRARRLANSTTSEYGQTRTPRAPARRGQPAPGINLVFVTCAIQLERCWGSWDKRKRAWHLPDPSKSLDAALLDGTSVTGVESLALRTEQPGPRMRRDAICAWQHDRFAGGELTRPDFLAGVISH